MKVEGVEIHNPDIHGLLPVYLKDPYEGFEVKAFPEMTEAELDRYITANVDAVREVVTGRGGVDVALAGHLVMGPCILARARIGDFAAKIHGSALEYTVKPQPPLPALRGGGDGGRLLRPHRLPPHRRVALGGAADGPRPAGEDEARALPASTPGNSGRVRAAGRGSRWSPSSAS